jgi:DNA-binding XRE family transcriptional regulator
MAMEPSMPPHEGSYLKAIRQGKGLALYGLAALARVSPTTLCAMERWNYQPSVPVRQRIAMALCVTVADIWPDGEGRA